MNATTVAAAATALGGVTMHPVEAKYRRATAAECEHAIASIARTGMISGYDLSVRRRAWLPWHRCCGRQMLIIYEGGWLGTCTKHREWKHHSTWIVCGCPDCHRASRS